MLPISSLVTPIRATMLALILFGSVAISTQSYAGYALFAGSRERVSACCGSIQTVETTSPELAEVNGASPASFSLESKVWQWNYTFTGWSFTGYPNFSGTKTRYNKAGGFAPDYLPANVQISIIPNTTAYPQVSFIQRTGIFRFTPGPNGFGGNMGHFQWDRYVFTVVGQTGYYQGHGYFKQTEGNLVYNGTGSGFWTATHTQATSGGVPLVAGTVGAYQQGPNITGMAFMSEMLGPLTTVLTWTGTDSRTPNGNSGTISLVQPNMVWFYNTAGAPNKDGTSTITWLRNGSTGGHLIDLEFLPEPSHAVLLGVGVLGLLTLRRSRG